MDSLEEGAEEAAGQVEAWRLGGQQAWGRRVTGSGLLRSRAVAGSLLFAALVSAACVTAVGRSSMAKAEGGHHQHQRDSKNIATFAQEAGFEAVSLREARASGTRMVTMSEERLEYLVDSVVRLKQETDELKHELKDMAIGFLQCGEVTCHGTEQCCGEALCCGVEGVCCGELCCSHGSVCCTNDLGSSICGAPGSSCQDDVAVLPGTILAPIVPNISLPALPPIPVLPPLPVMQPVQAPPVAPVVASAPLAPVAAAPPAAVPPAQAAPPAAAQATQATAQAFQWTPQLLQALQQVMAAQQQAQQVQPQRPFAAAGAGGGGQQQQQRILVDGPPVAGGR